MGKVLFLGDIVGRSGRTAVVQSLKKIREEGKYDLVVVNGENAAAGSGITQSIANQLLGNGVDGITLGDHCWDQRGFPEVIGSFDSISRPFNLPEGVPGKDHLILEAKNGFKLGVVTMLGSQMMKITADAGFPKIKQKVESIKQSVDAVFVEIHAETTAEKVALGWYLDGIAGAVVGTHTHIPTADLRILPRGTAYLTDAGMSGPYDSVIGRDIAPVLGRSIDGLPRKFTVATENVKLCGVSVTFDSRRGLASEVEQISIPYDYKED